MSDIDQLLDLGVAKQSQGDAAGAEKCFQEALARDTKCAEAQQLLGGLKIQQGDLAAAERFLKAAIALDPGSAIAHLNLAAVWLKKGDAAAALTNAREAARLAPNAPETQRQVAIAAEQAGEFIEAARALQKLSMLGVKNLAHELKCATLMLVGGDLAGAKEAADRAARIEPKSPDLFAVMVEIAAAEAKWMEMVAIARGWVESYPNDQRAHEGLSRALLEAGDVKGARAAFLRFASNLDALAPHQALTYGRICLIAQEFDEAEKHIRNALDRLPNAPDAHFAWARVLTFRGALEKAADACKTAIALDPNHIRALVQLTTLERGKVDDAYVARMETLWDSPGPKNDLTTSLAFALGDVAYARRDGQEAFRRYSDANAVRAELYAHEGATYAPRETEGDVALYKSATYSLAAQDVVAAPETGGSPRIIFIVGMPRSGTTLVESILSAHSTVFAAGEVLSGAKIAEDFLALCRKELNNPERFAAAFAAKALAWREYYLENLPDFGGAPVVTDKLPINFLAIGALARIFPGAAFLFLERDPLDVCVSIFRHQFPRAYAWSHSLSDIGHFYRLHEDLGAFYKEALSDVVAPVRYQDFLDDSEAAIRALIAKAGLDWEDGCLNYRENERAIATFSSVAARMPISKAASSSAQLFEPYLDPLKEALGR